jgi:hypothetical protein
VEENGGRRKMEVGIKVERKKMTEEEICRREDGKTRIR